jgi:K+-transporting ATPase A subunit
MVGRPPQRLGRKIEGYQIKLCAARRSSSKRVSIVFISLMFALIDS